MKYITLIITAFIVCSCSSAPPPRTFSVDLNSPHYEAGETEAYFEPYLSIGSLKKKQVKVFYYPYEDAVCLQFKLQYISCNQFWDKTGRDAFVAALKLYQEDFERRKLNSKGRKAREVYGTAPGYFTWKKTPVSLLAFGNPKYSFGYQFNGKSVFFTTTQSESRYEDPIARSRSETSPVVVVYFTREQAGNLAELFSQERLQGLGKPFPVTGGGEVESALDGY